jgi:galactokinase
VSKPRSLKALIDVPAMTAVLTQRGLDLAVALDKATLIARAASNLLTAGLPASAAARVWLVPGRIEVLGKHTDYAGGRSLVTAVERGFCMVALPHEGSQMHVLACDIGEQARFEISPDLTPITGHWQNYPMTVVRRLSRNFPECRRGAVLALSSDLPAAAGVSSSSAFIVGVYLAMAAINDLPATETFRRNIDTPESLSEYLGTIENGRTFRQLAGDRGVGTFGGSEDHTAILCCQAGQLSQYAFCPVRLERLIPLPADLVLAVASSGVRAEKTRHTMEQFNRASRLAAAVVEAWNRASGKHYGTLGDAMANGGREAVGEIRQVLAGQTEAASFSGDELVRRFDHFYSENEQIIPAAAAALAAGDVASFGALVDRSQAGAEELLDNQVEQTIFLARSARQCGGLAASAFGAGFGGSVWALFAGDRAAEQLAAWRQAYHRANPDLADHASFFLTRPGAAAFELT